MAKFNKLLTRVAARSPIVSRRGPATYEGGPGSARDAKSELFLLAVSNMVGEDTFYEAAGERDARFRDPGRRGRARRPRLDRHVPAGCGTTRACARVAGRRGRGRQGPPVAGRPATTGSSSTRPLQRADEPGELLAYWTVGYGRAIPKPVKRGIADAVRRLYTERALLKYDTGSHGFRFGDVLELTHPVPASPRQGDLFAHAHRPPARPRRAPSPIADDAAGPRAALRRSPWPRIARVLLAAEPAAAAGMTWEPALAGWLQGPRTRGSGRR